MCGRRVLLLVAVAVRPFSANTLLLSLLPIRPPPPLGAIPVKPVTLWIADCIIESGTEALTSEAVDKLAESASESASDSKLTLESLESSMYTPPLLPPPVNPVDVDMTLEFDDMKRPPPLPPLC